MNGIKIMRERAGITQKKLADEMGIVQSTVAMWESGENVPRADKLPDLARILGCTVDDLFQNSEREKGAEEKPTRESGKEVRA